MSDTTFELRLKGENIEPSTIPIDELGGILRALSDVLTSIAAEQNPTMNPKDLVVGLSTIEHGSLSLNFKANHVSIALTAYSLMAFSITTRNFDLLPSKALEGINKIVRYGVDKKADWELYDPSESQPIAAIPHLQNIDVLNIACIKGETDIYGKIIRIGGVDPVVRLMLDTGIELSCACSEQFAINLAPKLYRTVGLHGIASWHIRTNELVKFRATELLPYDPTDLISAIKQLRERVGYAFEDIEDPVAYYRELRGE